MLAQRRHDGFKPAVAPHLDLRSVRRVGEDLGTNEPGSFAVREEVIVLIEELEGRSCGTSWMFGSNGHCGEDLGQWPDDVVHDAYGHRRESSDLIRRLVDAAHEPVEQEKEHLVGDVAQIGNACGDRIGYQIHLCASLGWPHEHGKYRAGDLEAGCVLHHLEIFAQHRQEAADVRVAPVTARTFTLL